MRKIISLSILPAVVTLLVGLAGCNSKPTSKPLNQLTSAEKQGYGLFQSNCAPCHLTNQGPSLQGLFRKQYLPSGAPANDDRVRATILHGRGMMPSFDGQMDDQQLQDLIAYLHTL